MRLSGARREYLAQRIEHRIQLFIRHRLDAAGGLHLHFLRHKHRAYLELRRGLLLRDFRYDFWPFPLEMLGEREQKPLVGDPGKFA